MYLRYAGRMGLMFSRGGYMTRRLLPVQKTFITFITVTVPAPNVLVVYMFGTGIYH